MEKDIKLLASDLDGTLFYPKRPKNLIAQKNLKFIRRFIDDGNRLVLVTGRSPDFAKKVVTLIDRKVDVIGMNGAYTLVDGEVNESHFLDFQIENVLSELEFLYPCVGRLLMSKKYPLLISTTSIGRGLATFYRFYHFFQGNYAEKFHYSNEEFFNEVKGHEVYKIMIFYGLSPAGVRQARKANSYLRKHYAGVFESSWTGGFIEITSPNSSKAQGINRYIEQKGIKHENVYVVGDSGNDISMFNEFHDHSFCLGHAHRKVKKFAKKIISRFHHLEKHI